MLHCRLIKLFFSAGAHFEIERLIWARYHVTGAFVIVRGLQMAAGLQGSGSLDISSWSDLSLEESIGFADLQPWSVAAIPIGASQKTVRTPETAVGNPSL